MDKLWLWGLARPSRLSGLERGILLTREDEIKADILDLTRAIKEI